MLLRDFSILKGGHFGLLLTGVDNLTIDNLTIDTDRDGMDIDCCQNVRVSNCTVGSHHVGGPQFTDFRVCGGFNLECGVPDAELCPHFQASRLDQVRSTPHHARDRRFGSPCRVEAQTCTT